MVIETCLYVFHYIHLMSLGHFVRSNDVNCHSAVRSSYRFCLFGRQLRAEQSQKKSGEKKEESTEAE